ncbi:hypothetical protein HJD18_15905 [Thermoleophilia bacterium SCSIO 60948]|nr:hypothetical protein HJD18_15905 [Thermoleophilia bacterium SCSIO 60948]
MKPRSLTFAAVALSTVALLGCGSEEGGDASGGGEPETMLAFELQPKGENGPTERAELSCPATDSEDEAACAALGKVPDSAIDPLPTNAVCTQQFGGEDLLNVTGTLDGRDINVDLSRADGCEIDRFEDWLPVLEQLYPDYEPGSSIALP